MRCVECGRENPEHFAFCGECGTALKKEVAAKATPAAGDELICGSCGRRNRAIFRFCGGCGTPLVQAAGTESIACGECGRQNPRHYRFCAGCGKELGRESIEATEEEEAATSARGEGSGDGGDGSTAPRDSQARPAVPLAMTESTKELPRAAVFAPPFLEVAAVDESASEASAVAAAEQAAKVETVMAVPNVAPSMLGLDTTSAGGEGRYLLEEEGRGRGWKWAAVAAVVVVGIAAGWFAVDFYTGNGKKAGSAAQVTGKSRPQGGEMTAPATTGSQTQPADSSGAAAAKAENKSGEGAIPPKPGTAAKESFPAAIGSQAGAIQGTRANPPTQSALQGQSPVAGTAVSGVAAAGGQGNEGAPEAVASNEDSRTIKGEQYLYGKGVAPDCATAVDNLKAAADAASARAQSMMGVMYATGHCVPRDLVQSYQYFARALQKQPWNVSVQKNMDTVLGEMSEQEREKVK